MGGGRFTTKVTLLRPAFAEGFGLARQDYAGQAKDTKEEWETLKRGRWISPLPVFQRCSRGGCGELGLVFVGGALCAAMVLDERMGKSRGAWRPSHREDER
jgi:hypothetical protein